MMKHQPFHSSSESACMPVLTFFNCKNKHQTFPEFSSAVTMMLFLLHRSADEDTQFTDDH